MKLTSLAEDIHAKMRKTWLHGSKKLMKGSFEDKSLAERICTVPYSVSRVLQ